eukprot:TRINITY_DN42696_c0_g1_i1.p1 TRINITY_DN42696_c0_g1~~TRINITY_DN42696_c0_g1_i1.p1  ORF type:complete len:216 (+),score=34.24 TRINITY_DN42696_c0_g1_i1:124-771(+)
MARNPRAVLATSMGDVHCEIFLDRVPSTASNFIDLCKTGFYDGMHFHKVVPKFMLLVGCPFCRGDAFNERSGSGGALQVPFTNLKTGEQEPRKRHGCIKDEQTSIDSNKPGTLAMMNNGKPHSSSSQFFFNLTDNSYLDWFSPGDCKHVVFGRIIQGQELVEEMQWVPCDKDVPLAPLLLHTIRIEDLDVDPEILATASWLKHEADPADEVEFDF